MHQGAKPLATDHEGQTPLHHAVCKYHSPLHHFWEQTGLKLSPTRIRGFVHSYKTMQNPHNSLTPKPSLSCAKKTVHLSKPHNLQIMQVGLKKSDSPPAREWQPNTTESFCHFDLREYFSSQLTLCLGAEGSGRRVPTVAGKWSSTHRSGITPYQISLEHHNDAIAALLLVYMSNARLLRCFVSCPVIYIYTSGIRTCKLSEEKEYQISIIL